MNSNVANRHLTVYIATNPLEKEMAMALRYDVFNLELQKGMPSSHANQKDIDEYDEFCEHLIVMDWKIKKVVGTYRILTQSKARNGIGFYSENEFFMDKIYSLPGEVAEVGRSCVHPEYRDGSVISLLWSGLADYINTKHIRYLIGCASVHSTDIGIIQNTYYYLLEKNAISDENFRVYPKNPLLEESIESLDKEKNQKINCKIVPPLIKGYVRLGSKICGFPTVDDAFGTSDFFILFDKETISRKYGSHYKV